MQWLIDIIAERVIATIGIPPCYVGLKNDQGGLFNAGAIIDNAWHELDFSQDIPATGVTALNLHCTGKSTDVGDVLYIKSSKDVTVISNCTIRIIVANETIGERRCVQIEPDYKIYYRFVGTGWTAYKVHNRGYWL